MNIFFSIESRCGSTCSQEAMHLNKVARSFSFRTIISALVLQCIVAWYVTYSPWNFPLGEIMLLALPSLASGNTVIVKPSEVVPETGALLVETLQKCLPEGVIQLAQGSGAVGASLVAHPLIDLVAMTGSSATGRKILEAAAPQLKRVILEMGGKDPMIVCADADLEKAARDAVMYSLSNSGQVCCSIERIYVADSVYEEFQELTKAAVKDYKVGNGMNPENQVGPMVSMMQKDLVHEQVEDALHKGAKLLHQSEVPKSDSEGSFYPVTVVADVDDTMQLFTKETFGPVVAIAKFDGTEEEAVRLANDTG
jgi:succinate-semialdehyde dehydrogenase/glutarate-semialdehyde dehydrogenase